MMVWFHTWIEDLHGRQADYSDFWLQCVLPSLVCLGNYQDVFVMVSVFCFCMVSVLPQHHLCPSDGDQLNNKHLDVSSTNLYIYIYIYLHIYICIQTCTVIYIYIYMISVFRFCDRCLTTTILTQALPRRSPRMIFLSARFSINNNNSY